MSPMRAGLALVVGLGVPLGQLALDCRAPTSEACVWGKAYLPLSLAVGVLLIAPLAYGALTLIAALWRRGR